MLLIILTIVVAQMVDVVVVSGKYLSRVIRGDRAWLTKNVSQDLFETGIWPAQWHGIHQRFGGLGGWEYVFWGSQAAYKWNGILLQQTVLAHLVGT